MALRFPPLCTQTWRTHTCQVWSGLTYRASAFKRGSSRGIQAFGISGPRWKEKSCLGPHSKYTNTNENRTKQNFTMLWVNLRGCVGPCYSHPGPNSGDLELQPGSPTGRDKAKSPAVDGLWGQAAKNPVCLFKAEGGPQSPSSKRTGPHVTTSHWVLGRGTHASVRIRCQPASGFQPGGTPCPPHHDPCVDWDKEGVLPKLLGVPPGVTRQWNDDRATEWCRTQGHSEENPPRRVLEHERQRPTGGDVRWEWNEEGRWV